MNGSGTFWVDQNLIVDGKLRCKNVFALALYCLEFFLIQSMCPIIFWFANLAGLNVGCITLVWSLSPFFIAIADYFTFKTKLKYYHYIGSTMIVICLGLLSARKLFNDGGQQGKTAPPSPTDQTQ